LNVKIITDKHAKDRGYITYYIYQYI